MTSADDYSVRRPESAGEVAGLVPVAKNDGNYLKQPPRRNGRKARPAAKTGGPQAAARPAGPAAPPADGPAGPAVDDTHVDYYI
jgi:hypothetical protein